MAGKFPFSLPMNEQNPSEIPTGNSETLASSRAKRSLFPVSVFLLVVSAAFSGYLKYQVWNYGSKTFEIRQEILEFESKIAALKADPTVAAADLLNRNKASLETDIQRSEAHRYVTELMKLHRDYGVDFDGFQFSGGKITTVVSARASSAGTDPVEKVIRFVGDFRSGSGAAAVSPFELSEIRLVS